MARAADEIVAMMKSLVPVDKGTLRDSIGWTWGQAPEGSIVIGALKGAGVGGDLTITIFAGGKDAYYVRWVEFGTQAHSLATNASVARGKKQDKGTKHGGTSAQPFFYVSWRAANRGGKGAKAQVRKAVREAARDVAKSK